MIPVKDAVRRATDFAGEALGAERTAGVRLEEVVSKNTSWLITLSMLRNPSAFASDRDYKIFTVDKETGEVTSMKIRELAGV